MAELRFTLNANTEYEAPEAAAGARAGSQRGAHASPRSARYTGVRSDADCAHTLLLFYCSVVLLFFVLADSLGFAVVPTNLVKLTSKHKVAQSIRQM